MATKKQKWCEYKGKKYVLAWIGETKFGRRAKLSFADGSKEFWVPASAVKECSNYSTTSRSADTGWRGNGCSACRAKGDWCSQCYFDEFDC